MVGNQAAALRFDLFNLSLAALGLLPLMVGEQTELLDQLRLDSGRSVGEPGYLLSVIVGHFLLKPSGREIGQVAVRTPVTTRAHEVVVLAAVAGDRREQQPLAAEAAEDGALHVVAVPPGTIPTLGASAEDLLDPLPKLVRDKPGMRSLVFDALPENDAFVVGIAKQTMQRRAADLARRSASWVAPQAALV